MVLRRCRKLLREETRAVDAMQETFVNLLKHKSRVTPTAPSSFLYRVATNVCLNIIRSEKRNPEVDIDGGLIEIVDSIDPSSNWASRNILTRIFSVQKDTSAYIAVLFYLDGMTLEEIAREVGLSVSGVRKRLRQVQLTAAKCRESV